MEGARGGLFRTVLFVDEVHRWSKAQQDVLLPAVEAGTVTLIGATTENPYFSLNTPLLSRCLLLRLEQLGPDELRALLPRALEDPERGFGGIDVRSRTRRWNTWPRSRAATRGWPSPAWRRRSLAAQGPAKPRSRVTCRGGGAAEGRRVRRQGDAHYDVIARSSRASAAPTPTPPCTGWRGCSRPARTPASSRGGDLTRRGHRPRRPARAPDRVGRRPRRGARRAPRSAVEPRRGGHLPGARPEVEQRLHALARAMEDAASADAVPEHLRDSSYPGAKRLGHGKGYRYPHDFPGHQVEQEYRPVRFQGTRYYEPSGEGEDT